MSEERMSLMESEGLLDCNDLNDYGDLTDYEIAWALLSTILRGHDPAGVSLGRSRLLAQVHTNAGLCLLTDRNSSLGS
jgi:hypothetical protein